MVCSGAGIWLIPACAGKTLVDSVNPLKALAHPRVCGENHGKGIDAVAETGSSPRVRGKQSLPKTLKKNGGLIPACAGKTKPMTMMITYQAAHPRVCGENRSLTAPCPSLFGSSPRVRGKH